MEKGIDYRIAMEKLVSEISMEFLGIKSELIYEKIDQTLEKVSKFLKTDRSFIFQFSDEKNEYISCTNEWCGPSIKSTFKEMQNLPVNIEPLWVEHMKSLKPIIIPSIDSLPPESTIMRKLMEEHKVKSSLYMPMVYQGSPIGVFGFDSVHQQKDWNNDDLHLLQSIADIFVHIIKRRELELEKQKVEIDYHNLFNNMVDAFSYQKIITNKDGEAVDFDYVEINPSFTRITGLNRDEIIGKKASQLNQEKGLMIEPELIKKLGEVALFGKNMVFEDDLGLDGKWFSINAYSPKEGCFVTSFSDISEQKYVLEKLKQSEEMYRLLVESSNDFILKVGMDGTINYTNKYSFNTLGYDKEEIIGISIFDIIHPNSHDIIKSAWQKRVDKEEIHVQKIQVFSKIGAILDLELKAELLFDEKGIPISFFCIARDITGRIDENR
ncbi:MAG: PAS domain S-box protein [Promethearchaeota archaeon]